MCASAQDLPVTSADNINAWSVVNLETVPAVAPFGAGA
jgi:hypothetical protein